MAAGAKSVELLSRNVDVVIIGEREDHSPLRESTKY